MATTTPINGLPSPDDNSPNDPPIHFAALAAQLDTRLVSRFASGAARTSAISSPVEGQLTWLSDADKVDVYDGTGYKCIGVTETAFASLGLAGGWAASSGFSTRVKRTTSGQVKLHGRFKNSGPFTPGTGQTPITIPAPYKPLTNIVFAIPYVRADGGIGQVVSTISTDGVLHLDNNGGQSIAANSEFYLDGITYDPGYVG